MKPQSRVHRLTPQGTNSTMFTDCCDTAIRDVERACPRCGNEVIGADAKTAHERAQVRWRYATALWGRRKGVSR